MKINGIGQSNLINAYSEVKKKTIKKVENENGDSLQISNAGRNLSNLSIDANFGSSAERIEAVKKQISQGTYSPSASQIAQKMLSAIKGRDV